MLAAEMLLVPRESIPATVAELRAYLRDVEASGILRVTDAAQRVAALFHDPPEEAEWRPVLRLVSRLAFGTLPPPVREMYGIDMTAARRAAMRVAFPAMRAVRPFLPARFRYIAPYQEWLLQRRGFEPKLVARARERAGIRLDQTRSFRG
jgi:uncharacterized protein (DUF2236 family)